MPEFDERDAAIVAYRVGRYQERCKHVDRPTEGEFVIFPDGTFGRVSHDWVDSAQTSPGGSFHFGEYGFSFSGGLDDAIPRKHFTLTDETREVPAWIFHHDHWTAHNGVDCMVPVRVWKCAVGRRNNPPEQ